MPDLTSYKVIPGPSVIAGDVCCGVITAGSESQMQQAALAVAHIVELEAKDGWQLHVIDETIVHNACFGCYSRQGIHMKLLVFVRHLPEPSHHDTKTSSSRDADDNSPPTATARLQALEEQRRQGLVTDHEYSQQRQAIIRSL